MKKNVWNEEADDTKLFKYPQHNVHFWLLIYNYGSLIRWLANGHICAAISCYMTG